MYFLQIYTVKRQWKSLGAIPGINAEKLHRLFLNYEVAISYVGKGWQHGEMFGFGAEKVSKEYGQDYTNALSLMCNDGDDYMFGHAAYDLKNEVAGAHNHFQSEDGFDQMQFFVPELVVQKRDSGWWAGYTHETHLKELIEKLANVSAAGEFPPVQLTPAVSRETYLQKCDSLLRHIHRGDIYEINYCVDFVGEAKQLDPGRVFERLNKLAEAPMSALYKNGDSWLMCASPERYISRNGNKLISQPIKGTIRRGASIPEDEQLRKQLLNDPKERSENVMIVDLVRNDLSRLAKPGTVKVTELFGIYPFKTVHQMVSSIECEVDAGKNLSDALRVTFPMGSMTGAPKISAMKLAEEHEEMSRGIYSGCVGYVMPDGDFDMNVVIRSITWNAATGHVSAKAGSAITANSIPEKEYEECLLKAKAMMQALNPASV